MKIAIITTLFLITMLPCHARWGFTYAECLKQYGKPTKERRNKTTNVLESATFSLQGVVIRAFFTNKRVTKVTYRREDDQSMSAEMLLNILSAYSDKERDLYFQPPDALEAVSEVDAKMSKEAMLAASVKQQIWVRHGEKSSVTLLASYNRTAKMLVINTLLDKTEAANPSMGF